MNVDRLFVKLGINLNNVERLSGGDINDVFRVKTSVFKINKSDHYPNMFAKEASGLKLLSTAINVPEVLRVDEFEGLQFLEMSYVASESENVKFREFFGHQLANLHRQQSDLFGLDENNYIGSLEQLNTREKKWTDFYINACLQPMIELAVNKGEIKYTEAKHMEKFYNKLDVIYPVEPPSLVHGDLWSGNYLCNQNRQAVLIDPAVYYGHREMDIGMMHLFGGFDAEIYTHYNNAYPLEKGWQKRVKFSQLYPLLVHVNLFGKSYWRQVESILKQFK